MRIKEIEECCHAIDHLRGLINGCSQSDPKYFEFASDLILTYQELLDFMQEETKFLKFMSIKFE